MLSQLPTAVTNDCRTKKKKQKNILKIRLRQFISQLKKKKKFTRAVIVPVALVGKKCAGLLLIKCRFIFLCKRVRYIRGDRSWSLVFLIVL